MSKPKAQVRKAKYVPREYRDPTRDYQKEAETLMWTDENGKPISRIDLINYDTSDRTIFEPTSNSQFDQPQVNHYDEAFINQEKRKQKAIQERQATRDAVSSALDFVPIIGDIKGGYEGILQPLQQGNYLTAGIGAGMMLLPNIIEKPLKIIGSPIKRFVKDVANGNIKFRVPIEQNKYYRQVTSKALEDANRSGVIRANPNSVQISDGRPIEYSGASFTLGRLYNPRDKVSDVIIVGDNNLEYVRKFGHESPDEFNLPYKRTLSINDGDEVTPIFVDQINMAPTNNFHYWQKGKGIIGKHFWFKKQFSNPTDPHPDLQYLTFIHDGDINNAQKLRDLHFKQKAPNTKILDENGNLQTIYTGVPTKFNSYDKNKFGSQTDEGYWGIGLYGSADKRHAKIYAKDNDDDYVLPLYVNMEYPFAAGVYDKYGNVFESMEEGVRRSGLAQYFNRGYKGILDNGDRKSGYISTNYPVSDNIKDEFVNADGVIYSNPGKRYDEVVIPEPTQMKFKYAITYDDNGLVIPLSKRDDFSNPDMRYKKGGVIE